MVNAACSIIVIDQRNRKGYGAKSRSANAPSIVLPSLNVSS
jgi:hypothetical protein